MPKPRAVFKSNAGQHCTSKLQMNDVFIVGFDELMNSKRIFGSVLGTAPPTASSEAVSVKSTGFTFLSTYEK
jgi:hypothetical protein